MDQLVCSNFIRFEARELSTKDHEKLLLSIGETEDTKKHSLEFLIKRLKEQEEFDPCLDEKFLLKFLRNSKFNCTKACFRIRKFYDIQKKFPDYFERCSQKALVNSALNNVKISPYRLKDNSILVIHKYFQLDLSKIAVKEKFYLDLLLLFKALENPLNQMSGITFLIDTAGFSFTKMFHYNPNFIRISLEFMQGAFPYRVKNIHVVNMSEPVKILYNIFYPFLSKKMQERFHIHTDSAHFKDLHSFVSPETLPKEYGGHLEKDSLINGMEDMYQKEEYFRKYAPYSDSKYKFLS